MTKEIGKCRFTYFTSKYQETFDFYKDTLELSLAHAWDRSENDKGALFEVGSGLVEILYRPDIEKNRNQTKMLQRST